MTTTRQQILRSSTPGQVPAAGTRAPGELWTTFPDLQLGVIDASKNAQKLVAVRFFSVTANYVAGDFVIQAGVLYAAKGAISAGAFNPTQWTQIAAATDANGPYLPIAGGTLTGALTLNADPGAALGAATRQYVDGKVTAAPFLPLAGGTMLAPIILSGPPTIPLHAATKAYVDSGAFVPIAGGAMTGDLILNRNPQVPLGAATKQYVDVLPVAMNDNRIINGDMRIDQRNNGAGGTLTTYMVDRWQFAATLSTKGTWQRAVYNGLGFPNALSFTSNSAYTLLAGDAFVFMQTIEADMVSDFQWGTAAAQAVTLSFVVSSTLTGTFGGSIRNAASTRSYPFTYSIPTAGPQRISIPIPGDTAGTWVMGGNAGSVIVGFDLGTGATYRGPAGAWAGTQYNGATGTVSVVGTNAAQFYVTGVKLEIGSVATPYNRQSLAKSLADCQRYYQVLGPAMLVAAYNVAGGFIYGPMSLPVIMRAGPTVAYSGISYGNASALVLGANTNNTVTSQATVTALGAAYAVALATFSAEL